MTPVEVGVEEKVGTDPGRDNSLLPAGSTGSARAGATHPGSGAELSPEEAQT